MFLKKSKYKNFILGIISGIILGSSLTYITYRYNIPVIERIRYIKIPYLSSGSNSSASTQTIEITNKEKQEREFRKRKALLEKQAQMISDTDTNNRNADNSTDNKVDTIDINKKLNTNSGAEDKDIVVVKDAMIFTKQLPLSQKEIENAKEENKLTKALTDDDEKTQTTKLLIEFWKSPLNYKGYKMSDDKLIIYGIEEPDMAKFVYLNNSLYMEYPDEFYRFDKTEKFRTFTKITNVPLLNQLKQIPK